MPEPTPEFLDAALAAPMGDGTVADWFGDLLRALWREGEGFSANRPLGDSDWQYGLGAWLALHGHLPGVNEEDIDWSVADPFVDAMIKRLVERGATDA